jgi:hypothetical protein
MLLGETNSLSMAFKLNKKNNIKVTELKNKSFIHQKILLYFFQINKDKKG